MIGIFNVSCSERSNSAWLSNLAAAYAADGFRQRNGLYSLFCGAAKWVVMWREALMAAVLNRVRAFFKSQVFTVDQENPGDIVAREVLLDRVMGVERRRKSSEKLRQGRKPAEGLALVARDQSGHVIGTVRLWNIDAGVNLRGEAVPALLLGPLAVSDQHEGKGIGTSLMRAAIEEASSRGHTAILLVGDASYYERFGFAASKAQHLVMPGPFERHRFLGLELKPGALEGAAGMLVASEGLRYRF